MQAFEDEDESSAYEEILALPSDFSSEERAEQNLNVLADYELELRIGTAFDQLETVRQAVQHRAQYIDDKKKHARGHAANAEAEKSIQNATHLVQLLAKRYNKNYSRICSLRPKDYDATSDSSAAARLKQINLVTDLTIANLAAIRTLGDSKVTGSWIWNVREVTEANEHKHDFVQWARALMQKRRDDEAVSLRCEEFRRGREACRTFEGAWSKPAETVGQCRGMRAYAYKQVDMYKEKRAEFEAEYDGARRKDVDSEQLDHMRVSGYRRREDRSLTSTAVHPSLPQVVMPRPGRLRAHDEAASCR
ncbi:hypothetical protein OH76DRAFT_1354717 [Lentinus brumalis]|uniref:Uncharacterized protein n=1 Tax=Lentinus brumalis TaxID=2498619 RepID=A0A371D3P9_9APHY|nr:hypothetical protein OH76DRAFT_1354717 [Polyporus brumalis]